MNSVHLVGTLVAKPELLYGANGNPYAKARIAINKYKKGPDGQYGNQTAFLPFTILGARAEIFAKICDQGSLIGFKGEIEMKQWNDKQTGDKRSRLSISGFDFELYRKSNRDYGNAPVVRGQAPAATANEDLEDSDVPF